MLIWVEVSRLQAKCRRRIREGLGGKWLTDCGVGPETEPKLLVNLCCSFFRLDLEGFQQKASGKAGKNTVNVGALLKDCAHFRTVYVSEKKDLVTECF